MNSRERFIAALNHEEADRVPMHDSPWAATIKRWKDEGLTTEVTPAEYFDFGMVRLESDTSPRFPVRIVEEDEEYILTTTSFGGRRRNHRDYSTTPEIVDYPCKSKKDWGAIKERLLADRERVDWEGTWTSRWAVDETGELSALEEHRVDPWKGLKGCHAARENGKYVAYMAMVGYDKIQNYVATEDLLVAVATDPNWVRDMYETDADLVIAMYEIMKGGGFEFDGAWLTCDLGYRNGLLFSPQHYKEQLRPTMRRLFDFFRGERLPVILHSCGCVNELVPLFVEDGLSCLQPLEVKSGMDVLKLKEEFGDRLALMGGIDVRAMADSNPAVIEEEIRSKISVVKKGGGYIYHSDHSVPNNVSLDQYKRVLELVRQYGDYGA